MKYKYFFIFFCGFGLLCWMASASLADVTVGFNAGRQFADSHHEHIAQTINQINLKQIPGFNTDYPPETNDSEDILTELAQQDARRHLMSRFIQQRASNNPKPIIRTDQPFFYSAKRSIDQAPKIFDQSRTFCSSGRCTHPHYDKTEDFESSLAVLSSLADASKEVRPLCHFKRVCQPGVQLCQKRQICDVGDYRVFDGQWLRCRDYALNFNNCCADHGWGQVIGLAGCNEEEKILGHKKEKQACHEIGTYCARSIHLGPIKVCLEHKRSYCCFRSQLGNIVQAAGHRQLAISWGSAEHPNCEGLSPASIQRMDFARIDFTEAYRAIHQKIQIYDPGLVQKRIREKLEIGV
jgi:conjugal transfer mating pair stabilization protein TraN